ncbi:hypothetical protein [Brevundimonas sp. A19_0]|uniref:hypothetical protein n=1 Tax=Brevundimonas sp. A19_0 TaxID=2821087 RepID=UPI001ADB634F|nr:hypothetical protein [Brevundimonas sp. A19_0]MBO9501779.1 hypothetical protein [Brevundimonas sp. A19_0]
MTDWIKAINPTAPITTRPEATAAARASALAILLGVAFGIFGVVRTMGVGTEAMEAMMVENAQGDAAVAGMAGAMAGAVVYFSIGMVVVQAIFGLVQWAKPNRFIPILFIILVVLGLLSSVWGLAMASQMDVPANVQAPLWLTVLTLVVLLVELVLHIAGLRGASRLDQLKKAEFPNS